MFFWTHMIIMEGNLQVKQTYERNKIKHTSDSQYVKSWQFLATKSVTVPFMSVPFKRP